MEEELERKELERNQLEEMLGEKEWEINELEETYYDEDE